jgi:hypothetical protein
MRVVNTRCTTHKLTSSVFIFLRGPWILYQSRVLKSQTHWHAESLGGDSWVVSWGPMKAGKEVFKGGL